jgi:hypothetical protein
LELQPTESIATALNTIQEPASESLFIVLILSMTQR